MDTFEYERIIQGAIADEVEAWRFYQNASKKISDPQLKSMFTDFAREEKEHYEILRDILRSGSTELPFEEIRDFKVAETVDAPKLTTDMKPADAFAIAMKNEEEAMKGYTSLANEIEDPGTKKVFMDLAAMERGHKLKMENAFVDIGYPEVW